jgi:putative oxidoreductase
MNVGVIPQRFSPYLLSIMRIMVGLLFLEHGTGKIFDFPAIQGMMLKMMGSGMLYFTGAMELVGGLLITLGLFTRPVAFVLSGFMAAAYFMAHFPQGFFPVTNYGEAAVLYCFVFLFFAGAGAGPLSVDAATGAAGETDSALKGARA